MIKAKRKAQSGNNTEHAILGPSAAKKWLGCSAALVVEQGIPNESGQAAINGTAMHTLSEVVLNRLLEGGQDHITPKTYLGAYVENAGKGPIKAHAKAPKGGVLINDDMVKQTTLYVDYWRPLLNVAEFVKLEMRADLTKVLHPGFELPDVGEVQTFGTADMVMLVKHTEGDTYMLIVGDLKTGRHKVDAKENKQLMLYALGLMRRFSRLGYDISLVRLVIFQPFAGGASEWDIKPEALDIFAKFASKRAIAALEALARGKKGLKTSDFKPSADACEWCRFADQCGARTKAAVATMQQAKASDDDLVDTSPAPSDREARRAARKARRAGKKEAKPGAMTPEELKAAYEQLPQLRQHISAIEAAVFKAVMAGEGAPLGLKMVAGKEGNRAWTNKDQVEAEFTKSRIKRDLVYKESLISPTDAEKVFKDEKPKVWERLQNLITRSPAKPAMAPIDDPRPEWTDAKDEDLADE